MSYKNADPVVSFKFRVAQIYQIVDQEVDENKSMVRIVTEKYTAEGNTFQESDRLLIDTENTIAQALKNVAANNGVHKSVRDMSTSLEKSILYQPKMEFVLNHIDSMEGGQLLKTRSVAYGLPARLVSAFKPIDPGTLDDAETTKVTKKVCGIIARQGAEYIHYLFRLAPDYFSDQIPGHKCMYDTGIGYDQIGMFRFVLYADMKESKYTFISRKFGDIYAKQEGRMPFHNDWTELAAPFTRHPGGVENHHMIPFVYIVILLRESSNTKALKLFVKFVDDLGEEFQKIISIMLKPEPLTNNVVFSPLNVPSDNKTFWTRVFDDRGFANIARKVAIDSYEDFFPEIEHKKKEKLWSRDKSLPSFEYTEVVTSIGEEMFQILSRNYLFPRSGSESLRLSAVANILQTIDNKKMKIAFSGTDVVSCGMIDSNECEKPVPFYIRDVFDYTANDKNNSVEMTKMLVLYFIMVAKPELKKFMKKEAMEIFSSANDDEMFPQDSGLAALVFHLAVCQCLFMVRDKLKWSSSSYESENHPTPWSVLVEHTQDLNGMRVVTPDQTGLKAIIQETDRVNWSHVGGYINKANDTKLGIEFRTIRAAIYRMAFGDSKKEHDEFYSTLDMVGYSSKAQLFKDAQEAYYNNSVVKAEIMATGATKGEKFLPQKGYLQSDGTTVSEPLRELSAVDEANRARPDSSIMNAKLQKFVNTNPFSALKEMGKFLSAYINSFWPDGENYLFDIKGKVKYVLTMLDGKEHAFNDEIFSNNMFMMTDPQSHLHEIKEFAMLIKTIVDSKMIRTFKNNYKKTDADFLMTLDINALDTIDTIFKIEPLFVENLLEHRILQDELHTLHYQNQKLKKIHQYAQQFHINAIYGNDYDNWLTRNMPSLAWTRHMINYYRITAVCINANLILRNNASIGNNIQFYANAKQILIRLKDLGSNVHFLNFENKVKQHKIITPLDQCQYACMLTIYLLCRFFANKSYDDAMPISIETTYFDLVSNIGTPAGGGGVHPVVPAVPSGHGPAAKQNRLAVFTTIMNQLEDVFNPLGGLLAHKTYVAEIARYQARIAALFGVALTAVSTRAELDAYYYYYF
jgi:hypothetical protein